MSRIPPAKMPGEVGANRYTISSRTSPFAREVESSVLGWKGCVESRGVRLAGSFPLNAIAGPRCACGMLRFGRGEKLMCLPILEGAADGKCGLGG